MHELDLMPLWAKHKKQQRWLTIRLAIAEAVIFLILLFVVGLMYGFKFSARLQVAQLEAALTDAQYNESEEVAEALKEAEVQGAVRQQLLDNLSPPYFDYVWITQINSSIPAGVLLTDISMGDNKISISAIADDFTLMEQHRRLLTGDCFSQAWFGAVVRMEDGHVRYSLLLRMEAR